MLTGELDLGRDPWVRLAEGKVPGHLRWNGGPPRPVEASIRGAHSRKFPKRSLQVWIKGERLPDAPPDGHTVQRLHLNADYIDPTLMRSALSFALFEAVGAPAPRARHVALNVSGDWAGVYVALESVDHDFCRRRGWPPGQIYYGVSRNANFALISPFNGSVKAPLELGYQMVEKADPALLRHFLMDTNLASGRRFPAIVRRWIDVDGYLRWLMVAVFVGNRDGFVHNYALYHDGASGQFRIIPWDYDATFGLDIHGRPARLDRVPVTGWNKLTQRLMEVPEFRARYKALFAEALAGPLHPGAISGRIDTMCQDLDGWIDRDQQTVGGERSFQEATARLKRWPYERGALLLEQLRDL